MLHTRSFPACSQGKSKGVRYFFGSCGTAVWLWCPSVLAVANLGASPFYLLLLFIAAFGFRSVSWRPLMPPACLFKSAIITEICGYVFFLCAPASLRDALPFSFRLIRAHSWPILLLSFVSFALFVVKRLSALDVSFQLHLENMSATIIVVVGLSALGIMAGYEEIANISAGIGRDIAKRDPGPKETV